MDRSTALAKMKAPGDMRGTACYGVMQIMVTSICNGPQCSNCTQMTRYRSTGDMKIENVLEAIDSVADYPGVVGIFGGNPCLHKDFPAICEHLAATIPDKGRRGLWTNDICGHGAIVQDTFGYFNINVHQNTAAADRVRAAGLTAQIWGERAASLHGAVMVDMADVLPDEGQRWKLIAGCDVNQRWSPAIVETGGQLRGFFCEVAAAWSDVLGRRDGVRVKPGWWRRPMADFAGQVDRYCHHCGIPLRIEGSLDAAAVDTVSTSTEPIARAAGRKTAVVTADAKHCRELTDYLKVRG